MHAHVLATAEATTSETFAWTTSATNTVKRWACCVAAVFPQGVPWCGSCTWHSFGGIHVAALGYTGTVALRPLGFNWYLALGCPRATAIRPLTALVPLRACALMCADLVADLVHGWCCVWCLCTAMQRPWCSGAEEKWGWPAGAATRRLK